MGCGPGRARRIDGIAPEGIDGFVRYPWPGNVRELQHVVERAVILSDGGTLELPSLTVRTARTPAANGPRLDDTMREHILEVLRATNGVVSGPEGAAVRLGLKRTTLLGKMEKLGITPADVRSRVRAYGTDTGEAERTVL